MERKEEQMLGCRSCGKSLSSQMAAGPSSHSRLCHGCAIEAAELQMAEQEEKAAALPAPDGGPKFRHVLIEWAVIGFSLSVIIFRFSTVAAVFEKAKPIRIGIEQTSRAADECIRTLWKISQILQEGGMPGSEILDPASGLPFRVRQEGEDVIVEALAPGSYGLSSLRVSKNSPAPEAQ